MFEIQVLDTHGQWRNDLASDHTEDNRFTTVADAEAAMTDLVANGDPRDGWGAEWRVVEAVETYRIAEVLGTGDWGIIEEFDAKDDDAANAYAEEHYSHIDWYVLNQYQDNING
jgi:hypothetical protein